MNTPPNDAPPRVVMRQMLTAYWTSQALYVAARLGLADLLKGGPRPVADLAAATSTHASSLYRLLRALASSGVFAETAPQTFGLTPLADCLRSDVPFSQRSSALMMGEEHYQTWGDLLYSIQTGQTAFDYRFGAGIFDYLAGNPRAAAIFDETMTGVHGAETGAMLDAYDFSRFGMLVDVGGGNGTLIMEVLRHTPSLRGVLFDRAHVVGRAAPKLAAAGLAARCATVGGDFFKSVPSGGDAYLLRHIIHDWNDEQAQTILRNVRAVLSPHGVVLVVESVIPPGDGPFFGKWLDLNMLVIPGGKERTADEYRTLFAESGLQLRRVVPTSMEVSVIEASPN
jgi:hypothetical protein